MAYMDQDDANKGTPPYQFTNTSRAECPTAIKQGFCSRTLGFG